MLWGCFATGGTGALHKIDGIMRGQLCGYIEATSQDISQEVKAWMRNSITLDSPLAHTNNSHPRSIVTSLHIARLKHYLARTAN
jgi:hypothetical protein